MTRSTDDTPKGELILYQTEDGRTRIECRFEGETIWLTQALMAELFQTTLQNINLHLQNLYEERELDPEATIKSYLMVRTEGTRQVRRPVQHYSLDAILAVGFRVRSHRGTQFRKWANSRLSEYLVKGWEVCIDEHRSPRRAMTVFGVGTGQAAVGGGHGSGSCEVSGSKPATTAAPWWAARSAAACGSRPAAR